MKIINIGRSSNNDVVISNDEKVSRTHCQIIQDDMGNFRLIDVNSSNGTYINGVRRAGEVILNRSDIVRIGNTTLPWQTYFSVNTPGGYPHTVTPTPPSGPVLPPKDDVDDDEPFNVIGLIGFIGSLIGLITCWIPFGCFVTCLIGMVLSIIGLCRPRKGLATTGLIISIFNLIIGAIITILVMSA